MDNIINFLDENSEVQQENEVVDIIEETNNSFDEAISQQNDNESLLMDIDFNIKKLLKNTDLNDKLYSDLRTYQEGIVKEATLPLIKGIIAVINDFETKVRFCENEENSAIFLSIIQRLEDLLFEYDVYKIDQSDDNFNPKTQRTIKTIETDNPEFSGKIEKRLTSGFLKDDIVLVKETVNIYKFIEKEI